MQDELIGIITTELAEQLKNGAGILLIIVSVSYVSSVFTATTGESDSGMKDIISFAVICLLCVPMMENVKNVIANATETIEEIKVVMLSSIPALCATQIGDAVTGAAIFITLTQTAAVLLSGIFLPLALAYTVVGICGSVSDRFSLDGVKGMVKYVFNWGLGLMMMGFSCAATLSGALTGAKTSMAARTLKYTGAMVPVVGRYLAESTDMVFAGAAAPCVKMATHVLIYRIAGIMIRPVAAPKISNAVTNVGDAFMMITGITALMSVLSVLNVAVLVTLVRGGV